MKSPLTLVLLLLIGTVSFCQNKQSGKVRNTQVSSEMGLIKISIIYPFAEGNTFNMNYYETRHMPLVAGFLGSNLVKYTIEKGVASGIPNTPLPFMAVGTFYVKSLADYQAAIAPNREVIRADFPNYTNASPIIFISEVVH
ncbi:MAG: EthD family reductase [Cyclobacteriaceae bacterium]|nr:EthD family reductase [Cyclobacteriaceae bacterium]